MLPGVTPPTFTVTDDRPAAIVARPLRFGKRTRPCASSPTSEFALTVPSSATG